MQYLTMSKTNQEGNNNVLEEKQSIWIALESVLPWCLLFMDTLRPWNTKKGVVIDSHTQRLLSGLTSRTLLNLSRKGCPTTSKSHFTNQSDTIVHSKSIIKEHHFLRVSMYINEKSQQSNFQHKKIFKALASFTESFKQLKVPNLINL